MKNNEDDDYDISIFNICNYSTITTAINYNCAYECCQNSNKNRFLIKVDSEFDVEI